MQVERTIIRNWNINRARDNAVIRGMTDAQHRAVSTLALYMHKLIDRSAAHYRNERMPRAYSSFLLNCVPTMLHAAGLPELSFEDDFSGAIDTDSIIDKINHYLGYIDRKFGTWYELTDPYYAA